MTTMPIAQRFPREMTVQLGRAEKVVRITWFERLGQAVLAGATQAEIEELARDHFGERAP